MSKVQDFINSGILDEYCLGLLQPEEMQEVERMADIYPDVRRAIDQRASTLNRSDLQPRKPTEKVKKRIWSLLDELSEPLAFELQNLPLLNRYSDSAPWQRTVDTIQPAREFRNRYLHPLPGREGVEQFILWVKQDVQPEQHHDERESFLILEGECECRIGTETVQLKAGDYVEIPLGVEHAVRVLSPEPVKAIVQRIKI